MTTYEEIEKEILAGPFAFKIGSHHPSWATVYETDKDPGYGCICSDLPDGYYKLTDVERGEIRTKVALLMTAAPELAEALDALWKQALQSELNSHANEWGMEAIEKATAALKKAGVE